MTDSENEPTVRIEMGLIGGKARVQDAQVSVVCSRGHKEALVLRFVRHVDAPSASAGAPTPALHASVSPVTQMGSEFPPFWSVAAVSDRSLDQVIQADQGTRPTKLGARCHWCGLDVQATRRRFSELLDTLVDNGVGRVSLEQLGRMLT